MTFKTVDQIHSHLVNLSNKERNITHEILVHLQLFQKISGHIKLGYPSIYAYMMGALKYSNDQAYRRLKAAKLLNIAPEIADKIRIGSINLTQAMQLQNAITEKQKQEKLNLEVQKQEDRIKSREEYKEENQKEISYDYFVNKDVLKNTISNLVEKIENKNSFDSQKIIADELQLQASYKDKVKPLPNKTVKMEIHLTEVQYEKLMRVKSHLSHQFPEQNNGDIIEHLCNLLLKERSAGRIQKETKSQTKTKIQKSACMNQNETMPPKAVKTKCEDKTQKTDNKNRGERKPEVDFRFNTASNAPNNIEIQKQTEGKSDRKLRSRYVPVAIRKYVMKRADNKCEFTSKDGRRCNSEFQLEIEHVVPFSQGGSHELHNLKCFCSYHNSYAATQLAIGFETII